MKLLDTGYWTSKHFYWQSIYNIFCNGIQFKSLTFFSACNPAIDLGGMFFDRKTDIYQLLPSRYVPSTHIVSSFDLAIDFMRSNNLGFPVIVKPNVGLKGFKVSKIDNNDHLECFFKHSDVNDREWLIQEYLDYKKEFSLLYYRYPTTKKCGISSLVEKEYPFVTGNGYLTLKELIDNYKNSFLDKDNIYQKFEEKLYEVPLNGEKIVLDFIGNYSRGAKFYSRMEFVNDSMIHYVSNVFKHVEGLNFFRIDFKANSLNDFLKGDFKVIEINGMKSEPLHIYDPESNFLLNHGINKKHWNIIVGIVKEQQSRHIILPTFKQGLESLISIRKMVK
ncbi:MAG: hypothetical protein V3V14_02175 [Saprospiraceae bacterium]